MARGFRLEESLHGACVVGDDPRAAGNRPKPEVPCPFVGLKEAHWTNAFSILSPIEGVIDQNPIGNEKWGAAGSGEIRGLMTAETAEPGTATTGNAKMTGRLLPAEGRVKRNVAGPEAGEDQRGQTRPSAPAIQDKKGIGDGEVVKGRFVGPLAELVSRQSIGRVGWRAEMGRCDGEAQVLEDLPDEWC